MPESKTWFRLDNAAKIYPPTTTGRRTPMFRLSVTLTEEVDREALSRALARVLRRFPTFSCGLRRGAFWYYLDRIEGLPPILDDAYNPMIRLKPKENGGFLFRVRVFGKRIALEFYHVLADGAGGMTVLLTLVREYLMEKYGLRLPLGPNMADCREEPRQEELEDSFLKYARKACSGRKEQAAYHPAGTPVGDHELLVISGTVETEKLKNAAKANGAKVGELLVALLAQALMERQKEERNPTHRYRPVKIGVPVDLRGYYRSRTIRNFSSYVNVGIESRLGDYTLGEILEQVRGIMIQRATEKQLNACFSANVTAERNLAVRLMPLPLKTAILRVINALQGDRYVSTTISNLGMVTLPEEMRKRVTRIDALSGHPYSPSSICACVSYNGVTTLNFSRTIREADLERRFFRSLIKMGVPVRIESNGRYY